MTRVKSEQRQRTSLFVMRLLPAERALLETAAAGAGVSLSEFVRYHALNATLADCGRDDCAGLLDELAELRREDDRTVTPQPITAEESAAFQAAVESGDHGPGCGVTDCPCQRLWPVCEEWMGGPPDDELPFCPRCGWARHCHEETL